MKVQRHLTSWTCDTCMKTLLDVNLQWLGRIQLPPAQRFVAVCSGQGDDDIHPDLALKHSSLWCTASSTTSAARALTSSVCFAIGSACPCHFAAALITSWQLYRHKGTHSQQLFIALATHEQHTASAHPL